MAVQALPRRRGGRLSPLLALVGGGAALALVAVLGVVVAVTGADLGCFGGGVSGGGTAQAAPSRSAEREIPPARLRLYQQAGRRYDLDWTFLASIGAQECNHGTCRGTNSSGCAGPMQISYVRGSPCSPGSGPTLWEAYGVDANRNGEVDVNEPADAIFAAARILRQAKGAPPAGGSYAEHRQAACNYYGACGDAYANYADQVMARAIQYGFRGDGAPDPSDPSGAQPAAPPSGSGCGGQRPTGPGGPGLGEVERLYGPRRLAPLPASITAAPEQCDARIVRDATYLARRYRVLITACYGIHSLTGEHPLGAALDIVPRDGDWSPVERLARDLGWSESCAASGLAPACANPPFRFIAYNGFPHHGDTAHCVPCAGGAHLHISWNTSSSAGQPDNAPLTSYRPADWIDVFSGGSGSNDEQGANE